MKPGKIFFTTLLLLFVLSSLHSLESKDSSWSIFVSPSFFAPILSGELDSNTLLKPSWGGNITSEYKLNISFPLSFRLGGQYSIASLLPVDDIEVSGTLSEASFLFGAASGIELSPKFIFRGFIDTGITYGWLNTGKGVPYSSTQAGIGFDMKLNKKLSVRLETAALYKSGLAGGLGVTLGLNYFLPVPNKKTNTRPKMIEFYSINITDIFPSLRSRYEDTPVGTVTIVNTGRKKLTDLRVSFLIPQYMDNPRECIILENLEPGESKQLSLYALFNDSILEITEASKVSGQVIVEYDGITESRGSTVLVYDRNALTWSDDRKAAAFVSSKDPWVLDLTGNIMASVMSSRNSELNGNLQTAIAIHEGLRAFGISYMLSPNRPFAKEEIDITAVDSLKFPRQTLGFRAGDCADLSVLYASCFEAAGIETAFVTVPGHIFIAADLGINLSQARARGMNLNDYILQDDKIWIPIETTMRNAGFNEVWRKGSEQWRYYTETNQGFLYQIHEAWTDYAPVGLPADGSTIRLPEPADIIREFEKELQKAVNRELSARLELLGPLEKGSSYSRVANKRGILYAKYGFYPEATALLKEAAQAGNTSALVNLGNISMIQDDLAAAYDFYQQAVKKMPHNPRLQANLAKSAAALGKEEEAVTALEQLRELNPDMADQYSGIVASAAKDSLTTRASHMTENEILWF